MPVLEAEVRPWEEFVTPLTPIVGGTSCYKLGETAGEMDLQQYIGQDTTLCSLTSLFHTVGNVWTAVVLLV